MTEEVPPADISGSSDRALDYVNIPLPSAIRGEFAEQPFSSAEQAPGESGMSSGSDSIAWKCLIIGCGTSNSTRDPLCGSCQSPRPSIEQLQRARVYLNNKAKQATSPDDHEQRLSSLRLQFAQELDSQKAAVLAAETDAANLRNKNVQLEKDLAAKEGKEQVLFATLRRYEADITTAYEALRQSKADTGVLEKDLQNAQAALESALQAKEDQVRLAAAAQQQAVVDAVQSANIQAHNSLAEQARQAAIELQTTMEDADKRMKAQAHLAAVSQQKALKDAHDNWEAHTQQDNDFPLLVTTLLKVLQVDQLAAAVPQLFSQAIPNLPVITSVLQILDKNGALESLSDTINNVYRFVNGWAEMNMTPLCIASFQGNTTLVELLLKVSNIQLHWFDENKDRSTALMRASEEGHHSTVQVLLANSNVGGINMRDMNGWTALMLAVNRGHTAAVTVLLGDDRVEVNPKNKLQRTALDLAQSPEIKSMLQAKGAVGTNLGDATEDMLPPQFDS